MTAAALACAAPMAPLAAPEVSESDTEATAMSAAALRVAAARPRSAAARIGSACARNACASLIVSPAPRQIHYGLLWQGKRCVSEHLSEMYPLIKLSQALYKALWQPFEADSSSKLHTHADTFSI